MKLVIAVVQDDDVDDLVEMLVKEKVSSTKLASTGGFLREGNTTLLIGVEKDKVDSVISIIRDTCKSRKQTFTTPIPPTGSAGVYIPYPIDVMVGGATLFVVDIDRFEKV
ncbi:MAG: cyclic-di-AMP receptor [Clostridiaceae bacterium]|nr:cyclic-di-AMP receptor [Clostridiaceae bacterium]